jgi:hypothetical protein
VVAQRLHSPQLLGSVHQAYASGVDVMLWVCAGIAIASALLAALFLPRQPTGASGSFGAGETAGLAAATADGVKTASAVTDGAVAESAVTDGAVADRAGTAGTDTDRAGIAGKASPETGAAAGRAGPSGAE